MTPVATDPRREFRAALPARAQSALHDTERVAALVRSAVHEQRWTIKQLVAECCRDWGGASNLGGLITSRLEHCARHPPATQERRSVPLCGRCDHGWIYDEQVDPPTSSRCPCRTQETPY